MSNLNTNNLNLKNNLNEIKSFSSRVSGIKDKITNIGDYTNFNKSKIKSLTQEVNKLSSKYKKLKDDDFVKYTEEFKKRLNNGEKIENIMIEAIALAREATRRTLHMYPYDTQVEAAIAMIYNNENITVEMKTGEGKTLVQILASYVNLLEATKDSDENKHKCVHLMTSNDALCLRDSTSNSEVFSLLGFTTGCVLSRKALVNKATDLLRSKYTNFDSLSDGKRRELIDSEIIEYKKREYAKDIVYATPTTIAFDYLHDNIIYDKNNRYLNKPFGYALIDEADDILIDQATSPLKLSTKTSTDSLYEEKIRKEENEKVELYNYITAFLYGMDGVRDKGLTYHEYDQYFKAKNERFQEEYAYCKDNGEIILSRRIEKELSNIFTTPETLNSAYFVLLNCIRARHAYMRGREYSVEVKDDTAKIILIDQNIGRKKHQSKFAKGMQEAIEAKEEYMENYHPYAKKTYHVEFTRAKSIKAMFTYPDFISMYEDRVSGMTGTSDKNELKSLYGLETYKVDTRKKNIRIDEEDELYASTYEKYKAIIKEVKKCIKTGQPVLIGTTSVKESIEVSELLKRNNINHNLLNAESEEKENEIIETAGLYGSITVTTNMAGRGTDIKLGEGVREVGGLLVIGVSKNKSKRIDTQLRGRAARQGDPGRTKYYFSLEDDLVKEFYPNNNLKFIKEHYDIEDAIKNKSIIKLASKCQELRESKDKKRREDTEKFNKSFMQSRKIMYKQRNEILECSNLDIYKVIQNVIDKYVTILVKDKSVEETSALIGHLVNVRQCFDKNKNVYKENLKKSLWSNIIDQYNSVDSKSHETYKKMLNYSLKMRKTFLNIIDAYWINHIDVLEMLKTSQTIGTLDDPFTEYERESTRLFYNELMPAIYNEMITYATNPNMEFGEYEINYELPDDSFIEHKRESTKLLDNGT